MNRRLAALLVLFAALDATAQPAPIPVRALFANPRAASPTISPDGARIAVLLSNGDRRLVATRPTFGEALTPHEEFDGARVRFRWLGWAKPDVLWVANDRRNPFGLSLRSRASELFSISVGDRAARFLGGMPDVAHWLPSDPEHVLVDDWGRIRRMRVRDGRVVRGLVQPREHRILDWFADGEGRLRAGQTIVNDEYQLWARTDARGELRQVAGYPVVGDPGPLFVAFHEDRKRLYVAAEHAGRTALFAMGIATSELELVASHPDYDIAGTITDPGSGRVVGAAYIGDRPEAIFFDAAAAAEHEAIRAQLARRLGRRVEYYAGSSDRSGRLRVLEVSSDTQPPVSFVYDASSRELTQLFDAYPDVDRSAETRRVTYQARDGLEIAAYLTLPPGREPKRLALLVLPHGGPHARDSIDWNPELQLFASRGFAVLQMNFRGSTGYGRAFEKAGYREWGGKIQDDIADGVKWAIAEGIADPSRVGIYGASFGGYAALMGAIRTPQLYRAAASYAGVSDLPSMLSEDRWYGRFVTALNREAVGRRWSDRERLRAASPRRHARDLAIPVLLGHGEHDAVVPVEHSRALARALRRAGRAHTYLEFPHEVHGFALESNRIRWYEALAAFFEKHLAPRPAGGAASPAS